jgi:hypothetical protein
LLSHHSSHAHTGSAGSCFFLRTTGYRYSDISSSLLSRNSYYSTLNCVFSFCFATAMKITSIFASTAAATASLLSGVAAFVPPANHIQQPQRVSSPTCVGGHPHGSGSEAAVAEPEAPVGFIDGELRGAAMRLHTKSQAPREGQAPEPSRPKGKHVERLSQLFG